MLRTRSRIPGGPVAGRPTCVRDMYPGIECSVGMWAANMLDYGKPPWNGTNTIPQATRDMWTAISTVPFPATRGELPEHEL